MFYLSLGSDFCHALMSEALSELCLACSFGQVTSDLLYRFTAACFVSLYLAPPCVSLHQKCSPSEACHSQTLSQGYPTTKDYTETQINNATEIYKRLSFKKPLL